MRVLAGYNEKILLIGSHLEGQLVLLPCFEFKLTLKLSKFQDFICTPNDIYIYIICDKFLLMSKNSFFKLSMR